MDLFVLPMAALIALAPVLPPTSPATLGAAPIQAQRSPGGAVATATISVRIIANSARISAPSPPLPDMQPRSATVTAADGSAAPALIYDFE